MTTRRTTDDIRRDFLDEVALLKLALTCVDHRYRRIRSAERYLDEMPRRVGRTADYERAGDLRLTKDLADLETIMNVVRQVVTQVRVDDMKASAGMLRPRVLRRLAKHCYELLREWEERVHVKGSRIVVT